MLYYRCYIIILLNYYIIILLYNIIVLLCYYVILLVHPKRRWDYTGASWMQLAGGRAQSFSEGSHLLRQSTTGAIKGRLSAILAQFGHTLEFFIQIYITIIGISPCTNKYRSGTCFEMF